MDRALVEQHLTVAERHVAQGQSIIVRQQKLVAQTEARGRDSVAARQLLRLFQETQAIHVADRDRLLKELDLGQPKNLGAEGIQSLWRLRHNTARPDILAANKA